MEKSALALEETIEEMEDEKKESSDETFIEDNKTDELSVEALNTEFEIIEPSNDVIEDNISEEPAERDNKEEETIIEDNIDCIEQNEKIEEQELEYNNKEDFDIESIEKENIETEIPETENVDKSFKNIKIKEEPIDEPEEQLEEEHFDFTNVEVKEEPIEPEPGIYRIFNIIIFNLNFKKLICIYIYIYQLSKNFQNNFINRSRRKYNNRTCNS